MRVCEREMETTFWEDFTIADIFGEAAILDTYDRAFNEWRDNYIYLTELVLVLNWKIWEHWQKGNNSIGKLYNDLWWEAKDYAEENLTGEELKYYIEQVD